MNLFSVLFTLLLLSSIHAAENCSICSFSKNGVYQFTNENNYTLYNFANLMGPSWLGHMYCCNGLPDASIKEVEVVDFLGDKRVLSRDKNKLSKRQNSFEVLNFSNAKNKKDIYNDYIKKPLKCHPLLGNNAISSPYSEILTGRKKANFREGYGLPKIAFDSALTCYTGSKCTRQITVGVTLTDSKSYSVSNGYSNSFSVNEGKSTSNGIDVSLAKSISDTLEISHELSVTEEQNGNESWDISRSLTQTVEHSTGYTYAKTINEEDTNTESQEKSTSESWTTNSSTTITNGSEHTKSYSKDESTNTCGTLGLTIGSSNTNGSTNSTDSGFQFGFEEHVQGSAFGLVETGISANQNWSSNKLTSFEKSHTSNLDINVSGEKCTTLSENKSRSDTRSWSKATTEENGYSKSDTVINGVSKSHTSGHSETDTYESSRSDSTSDAVTNSYSSSEGWSKSNSDSVGNSFSHNFGSTNTYSTSNTYSTDYSESMEKAMDYNSSNSTETTVSRSFSQEMGFDVEAGKTVHIYAKSRIYSVVIPWICGLDDDSGEHGTNFDFYISEYNRNILDVERANIIYVPIENIDEVSSFTPVDDGIITGTEWYYDISYDEYPNKLKTGQILYADNTDNNYLALKNGYRLTLEPSGNLKIHKSNYDTPVWETHTGFIKKMNKNAKARLIVTTNGHLKIEATHILDDSTRDSDDDWITIWDSLPINLQYTVGVSNKQSKYTLVLRDETVGKEPRIELYDEYYVMVWSSVRIYNDKYNKNVPNPHYMGYICPENYQVPTKSEVVTIYQPNDMHNHLDDSIKYIYTGSYIQPLDSCSPFLVSGTGIKSANGRFKMYLTNTGNLIMKDGSRTMWESKTANMYYAKPPYELFIDNSGELVIRDGEKHVLWTSVVSEKITSTHYQPYTFSISDEGEYNVLGSLMLHCSESNKCELLKGIYTFVQALDTYLCFNAEKKSINLDDYYCYEDVECTAKYKNTEIPCCSDNYKIFDKEDYLGWDYNTDQICSYKRDHYKTVIKIKHNNENSSTTLSNSSSISISSTTTVAATITSITKTPSAVNKDRDGYIIVDDNFCEDGIAGYEFNDDLDCIDISSNALRRRHDDSYKISISQNYFNNGEYDNGDTIYDENVKDDNIYTDEQGNEYIYDKNNRLINAHLKNSICKYGISIRNNVVLCANETLENRLSYSRKLQKSLKKLRENQSKNKKRSETTIEIWNSRPSTGLRETMHYFEPIKFIYKHCAECFRQSVINFIYNEKNKNYYFDTLYKYDSMFNDDGTRSLFVNDTGLWYREHSMVGNQLREYESSVYENKEKIIDRVQILDDGLLKIIFTDTSSVHIGNVSKNKDSSLFGLGFDENNFLSIKDENKNTLWTFDDPNANKIIEKPTKTTSIPSPTTPIVMPTDTIIYKFYNPLVDSCLFAPNDIGGTLTYGKCDESTNVLWIVPSYPRNGYFRSKLNSNWCLRVSDITTGAIELGKCDDNAIMLHDDDAVMKSYLSNDKCLELNSSNNEVKFNKCIPGSMNQSWYVHEVIEIPITTTTKTKTTKKSTITTTVSPTSSATQIVHIYNKGYKNCLYEPTKKGNVPVFGNCDSSNKRNKWIIPINGMGYYKSVSNNWCLQIKNINTGAVIVNDCNTNSIMQDIKTSYGGEAIWSSLSDNKCLGYSNNKINFNDCELNNIDQHWLIIPEDRCGYDYGKLKCSNNQCCSKYGWCGVEDSYCSTGCQSSFGLCN